MSRRETNRLKCLSMIILIVIVIGFCSIKIFFRRRGDLILINRNHLSMFGNLSKGRNRIPHLIHQTNVNHSVPSQWNRTVESVLHFHRDFEYHLWSHDEMKEFVFEHEPLFYNRTYQFYENEAQRIDSFRYVVLFHQGGIYLDMDNGVKQSFISLIRTLEYLNREEKHFCGFPPDDAFGLQTDFQMTTKGHPFYRQLIDHLHLFDHHYLFHHLTILLSAGPLYVTFQQYFFSSFDHRSSICLFERQMYHEFYHWKVNGATWHRTDTKIILYLFYHRHQIFRRISFLLLLCLFIYLFIKIFRRKTFSLKIFVSSSIRFFSK